jgi:hypothetical protein
MLAILESTETKAKYIKRSGEENMMDCLERNERYGVIYHYQGQLVGNYDKYDSVDEG